MLQLATPALTPANGIRAHIASLDRTAGWLSLAGARVEVGRDAALFWEGDDARYVYKVVSGAIRSCKILPDGRRQVADFFLHGDLVGVDLSKTYSFTAEAIVDTVALRYARRDLEALVGTNPKVGRALLAHALERLAAAQSQMLLLGRKSALERLASFLLALAERTGLPQSGQDSIDIAMTRADIADHLGMTVETVSRAFTELKRMQAIALPHPQRVLVLDREALEDLAEGAA